MANKFRSLHHIKCKVGMQKYGMKMEITIIASVDPHNSKPSGIRSYVMHVLNSLCVQGIKTTFVGVSYTDIKNISENYTFIPIIKNRNPSSYDFLYALLLKTPFLRLSKTSIIHAQREDQLFPFILFNKKNPKVCTLHGGSGEKIALKKGKLVGFIYDILGSFALKHTDKIIAVDESTKEYYLKKYSWLENKIDVIPVGVDLNLFKPMNKDKMRRVYGLQSDEKIIVYVGRLEKEKNLEFLLRAFKAIDSCQTEYKLLLVGDGRDRKELEKKAKDMGLTNVLFTGAMNQEKIPGILNCADVFVLCSLFESGPLVVQEAIACGIPVVTTNVGRVKEFVKDEKVGRIVEYDEFKFSKAIEITIDSMSDYNLYRRTIAEKFSFEETMSSLLKIYNNLNNRS